MDAILGFVVGYYMGAKGGRERLDQLGEACQTIAASQEFQAVLTLATSMLARVAAERGKGLGSFDVGSLVGDQLKQVVALAMTRKAA